MIEPAGFKSNICTINEDNFKKVALEVYKFQFSHNKVYRHYCELLGKSPDNVTEISKIPFLPIEFFKTDQLKTGDWKPQAIFKSSGTTGTRSHHLIPDLKFYHHISKHAFETFFGDLKDLEILALLPSYQEQGDSSLIHMVNHLMENGKNGRFYLNNYDELAIKLKNEAQRMLLIGVSFALLDFIEKAGPIKLPGNVSVMETGGMKGKRKEITRMELHQRLKDGFGINQVFSEYGMTELHSQAYAKSGQFRLPPWMQVMIRDINDPFETVADGQTGGINFIDLANIQTMSFVETKDLGKKHQNGSFEVLGRFDNADIRGCNLLF